MASRIPCRSLLSKINSVFTPYSSSSARLRLLHPLYAAATPRLGALLPEASRGFATRTTSSSLNDPNPNWSNRPPKETILLDGCDFEHWLVVMEKPEGDPTRDEIIDSYVKTLAMVVGSEEEARMKIYSVSTRHYFAFGALVSEELSYKLKELPKVRWVLPDSYLDVKNKDYGGEPFINGQAVPYDPKYHEEWVRNNDRAQDRNRRNDRPRNFDRSRNFERRRENMQHRDVDNRGPPTQNISPPPQNSMDPKMSPPAGNFPHHDAPQNNMPRGNYSAQTPQGNFSQQSNYPHNSMPPQNFPQQSNYPPHNSMPPQNNFPQQSNYPPHNSMPPQNFPQQSNYPPHNSMPPQNNFPQQSNYPHNSMPPQNNFPQQSNYPPHNNMPPQNNSPPRLQSNYPPHSNYTPDDRHPHQSNMGGSLQPGMNTSPANQTNSFPPHNNMTQQPQYHNIERTPSNDAGAYSTKFSNGSFSGNGAQTGSVADVNEHGYGPGSGGLSGKSY